MMVKPSIVKLYISKFVSETRKYLLSTTGLMFSH